VLVACVGAITVAAAGGLLTDISSWYYALRKPPWQPPDWLFGPVWTFLFALIAAAAVIAWQSARDTAARLRVLLLFLVNGALNIAWSALFFTFRRPDWALMEVAFLWASILFMIMALWRPAPRAALLLLPYLAWVSFAAVLTLAIVQRNAPFGG
jgi:tryptophan-rich sensory protein